MITFSVQDELLWIAGACLLGYGIYECLLGQPVMWLLEAILHIMSIPIRAIVQRFVLICKKSGMRFVKVSKKQEMERIFIKIACRTL